jgi:PLP dependent protein
VDDRQCWSGAKVTDLARRVEEIRRRVDLAAGGSGSHVTIVAVTKGFGPEAVRASLDAGLTDIGENYAQEAVAKFEEVGESALRWHFIGHAQRNKVRMLSPFIDVWQTIDSTALVDEVAKRAAGSDVMVEVNLSGAEGRSGCSWSRLDELVEHARVQKLNVCGLMGVGIIGEPEDSRLPFRRLAGEAERLQLPEVSMGMTNDFEVAVQEGSTMVRIGSAFFGSRPNSHHAPVFER